MFRALAIPDDEVLAAERHWNTEMAASTASCRPGAISTLQQLRDGGAHTGVVSAVGAGALWADLDHLQVGDLLDSVIAGTRDKVSALRARRADRRRAVYVGDTEYDMRCALLAGFTAIGIPGGYCDPDRLLAAGAAIIIGELPELVPILGSPG